MQLSHDIRTEIVYAVYQDRESMNIDIEILGAIKGIRYITFEDVNNADYKMNPYVYVIKSKRKLFKLDKTEDFPLVF
ncbi:hypothetical protein [Niallia circulans]|uniref:hypothetical protein n=1 Tax=Niallia circulans TaxID=1397 RepID=UPI00156098CC|nr:hypothetical protein [Niallia circulans]NRG30672.1 hypothetical protein [Niallia circulans]